ncbi:MAG: HAD family phosphatase [Candidatus Poribacteria bacterium]|nr:HAD family phosphatase [Candidatus Poribacteria bacterium]
MNPQNRCSAVIFDMDGLMLDTENISRNAWHRALADWNYTIPDEVYLQAIGRTIQGTAQVFRAGLGEDFPFDKVRQRKRQYVDEHIAEHGIPIKPGLLELIDRIDELPLPKAVASSTEKELVIQKLTITRLIERFDAIIGGDEIQNGKPAPDIFLAAAERLDVPPERCMVLEDSDAGVQAAHAAGMIPIAVPDLKPPSPETAALAYRILPSLHEVIAFL